MSYENSENKREFNEEDASLTPAGEEADTLEVTAESVASEESPALVDSNGTAKDTAPEANDFSEENCVVDSFIKRDEVKASEKLGVSGENLFYSQRDYDEDMYFTPEVTDTKTHSKILRSVYDFLEMMAFVTIAIVLCFAFVFRLNIVEGPSMEKTLHTGEYLLVSDLFYEATPGDIVVIQDMEAKSEAYRTPIVKRVIAVGGQTVDIDFNTWTLTVDGEVVDESDYRYLSQRLPQSTTGYIDFPVTLEEGEVFVMGDNRYNSADSRLAAIGLIDERCIVGKVYARIFPFDTFTVFKNPYKN